MLVSTPLNFDVRCVRPTEHNIPTYIKISTYIDSGGLTVRLNIILVWNLIHIFFTGQLVIYIHIYNKYKNKFFHRNRFGRFTKTILFKKLIENN